MWIGTSRLGLFLTLPTPFGITHWCSMPSFFLIYFFLSPLHWLRLFSVTCYTTATYCLCYVTPIGYFNRCIFGSVVVCSPVVRCFCRFFHWVPSFLSIHTLIFIFCASIAFFGYCLQCTVIYFSHSPSIYLSFLFLVLSSSSTSYMYFLVVVFFYSPPSIDWRMTVFAFASNVIYFNYSDGTIYSHRIF